MLPGRVGASLKQAPIPPTCCLPPPPCVVTSFGFRDYRIREVTVIPYSRWLTTAKPLRQGHSFKNTPKLVPSCPRCWPQQGDCEDGLQGGWVGRVTHSTPLPPAAIPAFSWAAWGLSLPAPSSQPRVAFTAHLTSPCERKAPALAPGTLGVPRHSLSHTATHHLSHPFLEGEPGHREPDYLYFPQRVEEPGFRALLPGGVGSEPFGVLAQLGQWTAGSLSSRGHLWHSGPVGPGAVPRGAGHSLYDTSL